MRSRNLLLSPKFTGSSSSQHKPVIFPVNPFNLAHIPTTNWNSLSNYVTNCVSVLKVQYSNGVFLQKFYSKFLLPHANKFVFFYLTT